MTTTTWQIARADCADGGRYAWYRQRPSGVYELVGCVCHHNPPVGATIVGRLTFGGRRD